MYSSIGIGGMNKPFRLYFFPVGEFHVSFMKLCNVFGQIIAAQPFEVTAKCGLAMFSKRESLAKMAETSLRS